MASFPGPIIKPADIATGEDILAAHVGPLWDETIAVASLVQTNESDIATNAGAIATNAGDIATNAGDISTLQTDVSTAQGDITTLQGDVSTNAGDITTLQGDVSTLQTDVTTAQGNISTNASDITDLQTDKQDVSEKGAANGYASLDGSGRVPASQLSVSALEYLGTWDAATNAPALADGTGSTGDMYRVSVGGTQDLGSGPITYDVGDYAIHNGSTWEKADTTDAVSSVAGKTGAVTLDHNDLSDFDSEVNALISTALSGASLSDFAAPTGDIDWDDNGIIGLSQVTVGGAGDILEVKDNLADSNPRFRVRGADGQIGLGTGGGSSVDSFIQRVSSGVIQVGSTGMRSIRTEANQSYWGNSSSTAFATPTVKIDGTLATPSIEFGDGAGSLDWTIERSGAAEATITGALITDDIGFHGVAPVGQSAHIADPAGGATVDAEARSAIDDILVVLESHGLTATV